MPLPYLPSLQKHLKNDQHSLIVYFFANSIHLKELGYSIQKVGETILCTVFFLDVFIDSTVSANQSSKIKEKKTRQFDYLETWKM